MLLKPQTHKKAPKPKRNVIIKTNLENYVKTKHGKVGKEKIKMEKKEKTKCIDGVRVSIEFLFDIFKHQSDMLIEM